MPYCPRIVSPIPPRGGCLYPSWAGKRDDLFGAGSLVMQAGVFAGLLRSVQRGLEGN